VRQKELPHPPKMIPVVSCVYQENSNLTPSETKNLNKIVLSVGIIASIL
jgi:hypothetical protein